MLCQIEPEANTAAGDGGGSGGSGGFGAPSRGVQAFFVGLGLLASAAGLLCASVLRAPSWWRHNSRILLYTLHGTWGHLSRFCGATPLGRAIRAAQGRQREGAKESDGTPRHPGARTCPSPRSCGCRA